jgi:transcriptional regulator with XRE-family HTH domain
MIGSDEMAERESLLRASRGSEMDRLVGRHLRERRSLLGLTHEELAGMVEVTDDKVRDFESGTRRISAEKLFDLSRVLNVHLGFFYRPLA